MKLSCVSLAIIALVAFGTQLSANASEKQTLNPQACLAQLKAGDALTKLDGGFKTTMFINEVHQKGFTGNNDGEIPLNGKLIAKVGAGQQVQMDWIHGKVVEHTLLSCTSDSYGPILEGTSYSFLDKQIRQVKIYLPKTLPILN
jgi:hypothetical protein